MSRGTILLSAGGTGGHLFPAEALAHALKARGWSVHLASDDRAARYAGSFPADGHHMVTSATIGSRNPVAVARAFWALWRGYREASVVLQRLKPKAVVGFGGYPTLPPVFAATRRGIPTLIHEQNAVMGRANRALSARVTAIAGGFLKAEGALAERIVETGNPVRPAVIEAAATAYRPPAPDAPFELLVFGGSQGAQFFSQVVPPAIAALPEAARRRLRVTQQARPEDEAAVRAAYGAIGVAAEISPFFTDMAARIAHAHLVIARAGASTVSEIAAIGRPALLVPYPHALDHDQAANAAALEAAGGAEVHAQATLSAEKLRDLLEGLMRDPARLDTIAAAARTAGKPDATRLLADLTDVIASGLSVDAFKQGVRA
ncbi:undecaprenyldiphospho-muramoylpentapeptide beta-N-acetylglucosaminyltransferase [Nitratireductor sp. CAU 1489]|uniref:UDP-N-acetylglucosamine--N-acetylmuramyl-(pentapeptide) pyrophosphoryl-undecaprenol N-acetylglucosamine transferase n=1 Tax=Nitratireductor arenosus TaxID=2682096 RepID=A0A844QEV7_9HYPH|nr:undecaprenyldiphospho-muramoylpentapeptide beta-N-acetylglucosaminyltransferase [Nitratireductor arenosus]MVA97144.1 undecaprenyldiphospho-muramoylpentapeptide beta-N-acetylglucosaminyltransferase [Nitratireductor arenosus]